MEEIIQEALNKGVELHIAGEFDLAGKLYSSVLKLQPNHADANHNMGLLNLNKGSDLDALPYLTAALQADQGIAQFWLSYLKALINLERLDAARRVLDLAKEKGFEDEEFVELAQLINTATEIETISELEVDTASKRKPTIFDNRTLNKALRLAEKKAKKGDTEKASRIYQDILVKYPKNKQAQQCLANLNKPKHSAATQEPPQEQINQLVNLYNQGQLAAVVEKANILTAKYPDSFLVWNFLGAANKGLGFVQAASEAFTKVTDLNPTYPDGFNNLGVTLQEQSKLDEAIVSFNKALSLKPDYAGAYNNMGIALKEQGKLDEAIASYNKALSLKPDYAEALNNRAGIYAEFHLFEEAMADYDRALQIKPDFHDANFAKALTLLLGGDYANGWPLYESRWQMVHRKAQAKLFDSPPWLGDSTIVGKTILVHSEQGLGDTIQFSRYLPLIRDRNANVIVRAQPLVRELLSSLDGISEIFSPDDELPDWDFHCPMMSLPLAFGTTLETIPFPDPYLSVDKQLVKSWERRLGSKKKPRIAIAWRGNPENKNDWKRSIRLAEIHHLLNDSFDWICLHPDCTDEEAGMVSSSMQLFAPLNVATNLTDAAAICMIADAVITVDTSVAHIAGALGQPTFVMLPFHPDHRWLLNRTDSPWYKTIRLFRQNSDRAWQPVVEDAIASIMSLVKQRCD